MNKLILFEKNKVEITNNRRRKCVNRKIKIKEDISEIYIYIERERKSEKDSLFVYET